MRNCCFRYTNDIDMLLHPLLWLYRSPFCLWASFCVGSRWNCLGDGTKTRLTARRQAFSAALAANSRRPELGRILCSRTFPRKVSTRGRGARMGCGLLRCGQWPPGARSWVASAARGRREGSKTRCSEAGGWVLMCRLLSSACAVVLASSSSTCCAASPPAGLVTSSAAASIHLGIHPIAAAVGWHRLLACILSSLGIPPSTEW
jgi:hypothetical protein